MTGRPDVAAFAASLRRLYLLSFFLIALSLGVTVGGHVWLAQIAVTAVLVIQTVALEKLRVFVASMENRR